METKVMTITPEMAENWLELNKSNRSVSRARVNEYARAMLSGNWKLTHQGIAFNTDGELADGQHRLIAIKMAGIPVDMNVTFGLEQHAGEMLEIDVGRARSYANIIQMAGITDLTYKASNTIVTNFLQYKMDYGKGHVPAHVIADYIKRHYEELHYICESFNLLRGSKHKKAPSIVAAAALSALYGYENRDAIMKFGQVWTTNDTTCTNAYNVKIALDCRERVRAMRNSTDTLNYVENCIRCFANNRRMVKIIDCYKLDKSAVM